MATPLIGIKALLDDLQDRLETLTASIVLLKRDGTTETTLNVYLRSIPNELLGPNPDEEDEGREYPYLVLRQISGRDGAQAGTLLVRCFIGIFNPGADFAGEDDLEAILSAILQLPLAQDFAPFALLPEITFQFGSEKEGAQGVDKYFMTADLHFSREAIYLNY